MMNSEEIDIINFLLNQGENCPDCRVKEGLKLFREGGCILQTCSLCDWSCGIDDSVDVSMTFGGNKGYQFHVDESYVDSFQTGCQHIPCIQGLVNIGDSMHAQCVLCHQSGILTFDDQTEVNDNEGFVEETIHVNNDDDIHVKEEDVVHVGQSTDQNILVIEDEQHQLVSCSCGNEEPDIFEIIQDNGDIISVKCLNCDSSQEFHPTPLWLVECSQCYNDNEALFEKRKDKLGCLESLVCLICKTSFKVPDNLKKYGESRSSNPPKKVRVKSWDDISRGDHISFERKIVGYEHHAIVESVHPVEKHLHVIEYGSTPGIVNGKLKFAKIQEHILENVDPTADLIFKFEYKECFQTEEVLRRAKQRLNERQYNVFTGNCEHFATWCKTGVDFCSQLIPFYKRVTETVSNIISNLPKTLMAVLTKSLVPKVALESVDEVIESAILAIPVLSKSLSIGLTLGTGLLSLVIEFVAFLFNYKSAKRQLDSGLISKDAYKLLIRQYIGESIGGAVLGTALGFLTIVNPLLGITMGAAGNVAGRLIGRSIATEIFRK